MAGVVEVEDQKRKAFSLFEIDHSGFIKIKSLKNVFGYLGLNTGDDRCQQLINDCEKNSEGLVSFEDFRSMVTICSL